MTTVYDVPPEIFIERLAAKLKSADAIKPPEWARFVKTGSHREKAPVSSEWWFQRSAAVLRKIYVYGPVGTSRLAADFGGRRDRGSKPYKAVKGSRNITRTCLKQLQTQGLVEGKERRGRIVTAKGRALLDNTAHEVMLELSNKRPELKKYL